MSSCQWESSFTNSSIKTSRSLFSMKIGSLVRLLVRLGQTLVVFHFDEFEIRDRKLYYRDKRTPLMIKGRKLRTVGEKVKIMGKEELHDSGFKMSVGGKVAA